MKDVTQAEIISIHALVKRATFCAFVIQNTPFNFNPRPREEGDLVFIVYIIPCLCISIHALVKRATDMLPALIDLLEISIHALVKRAT